jgi:hypothetical protein
MGIASTPVCFDVTGSGNDYWAISRKNIMQSTDGGVTWDTAYTAPEYLDQIHAVNDSGVIAGWANGENASVVGFTMTPTRADNLRQLPKAAVLQQNFPNPFNPSTTIGYGLPERSHVTLTVYNTLGQQIATLEEGEIEAGFHEVNFDASSLASGVYLYRLTAGDYVRTRRLVLLR